MENEIKEILEWLNDKNYYIEDFGYKFKRLSLEENEALLDYITNLQDRIKELEQINEEHKKINGELRKNITDIVQQNIDNSFEKDVYKTRNEKAVDLIIEKIDYDDEYPGYMQMLEVDYNNLLETLQGKSDE